MAEEQIVWTFYDWLGLAGGIVISTMMLPQVYKSYKTRSTGDLSWGFLITYGTGLSLLGAYAWGKQLYPLVGPWCFEIVILFLQVTMKLRFDREQQERQQIPS